VADSCEHGNTFGSQKTGENLDWVCGYQLLKASASQSSRLLYSVSSQCYFRNRFDFW
jgi:hypothetical protein